jgi:hypothetical protein
MEHWGKPRWQAWLDNSKVTEVLTEILEEEFEREGFPSLRRRLVKKTDPEVIRRFLREIGVTLRKTITIPVGGSVALIMRGKLERSTDDVDVVDEVPAEIRNQHGLLHDLEGRYGLKIAHFQRRYLPMCWENRLQLLDTFGSLRVVLVDAGDVFLSKLFSIRSKDLDDMRLIAPQLDKAVLPERLKNDCASMLVAEELRKRAEHNWYILYGEPLPA